MKRKQNLGGQVKVIRSQRKMEKRLRRGQGWQSWGQVTHFCRDIQQVYLLPAGDLTETPPGHDDHLCSNASSPTNVRGRKTHWPKVV